MHACKTRTRASQVHTQTLAWIDLAANENLGFDSSLYAWLFYVLTGLHVAHVVTVLAYFTYSN